MGIVQAAQADYLLIHGLRHPFSPVTLSGIISTMILTSLTTYIIDIALLFRVIAVYPPHAVSRIRFALIIALPVLLKILRVVEWIIWSMDAVRRVSTTIGPAYVESSFQHGCAIARLAMTVLDNSYITFVFLWKLRSSLSFGPSTSERVLEKIPGNALQTRIRTLFWLAVSNFVLPVPILIAQLILLAVHHGAETFSYTILNILVGFVCVVCAVFATVWRGIDHATPEDSTIISTPLRFRAPDMTSGLHGTESRKSPKAGDLSRRYYHGELELGGMTFGTLRPSSHSHSDEGSATGDSERQTASRSS